MPRILRGEVKWYDVYDAVKMCEAMHRMQCDFYFYFFNFGFLAF